MTSPTPDQLKETDPPASAPAATAQTSTPLVVAALLAFALLYGLLAAVGVGMLGYQSLVEADVIDLWLLPRWLHGVLADALAIAALAIALWSGPRLSQWLAAALFWLGTSLLAIQGLSLHMSASWLTPQAMAHAGLAPMLVTVKTVGVAVGAPLALTAVFVALGRRLKLHGARSWARLALAATVALVSWAATDAARVDALFSTNDRVELENKYRLVLGSPLRAAAKTASAMAFAGPEAQQKPAQESLDVAAEWGLRINTKAGLPFVRDHVYKAKLPFARVAGATTKPNVIVLFYESLSAHMLEPYGAPHPGLTPNFNAMAKRSMVVDHWYNHVTPTVTGLRGQLCSLFPKLTWTPWVKAKKKPKVGMVYCLPHLLAANGYRTLYWSHVKPHVTYLKAQSIDWGFTEPSFHKQVTQPWIGEAPSSKGFGATDRQMMRALTAFIAKEPHDERPFFLALSTVQTHTGFSIGADGKPYKRPGGKARDQVLDTFHNLDDAFGDFWRAFQRSPRAKDTIVIVTADHALYPSDSHRAVAGPGYLDSKFSKLGFILYYPTHKLPGRWNAHSTSVDLAPTLAHLLELPQRKVPWLGWSIFGDRQRYKGALGLIYSEKLLSVDADGPRLDAAVGAKAAALRAVLGYTQTIEEQGLIWLK